MKLGHRVVSIGPIFSLIRPKTNTHQMFHANHGPRSEQSHGALSRCLDVVLFAIRGKQLPNDERIEQFVACSGVVYPDVFGELRRL